MFDVTAIGELLIDFIFEGSNEHNIELFSRNPGGSAASVLAMNARLGGRTAFLGKVGCDEFGYFLLKILQSNGIDTTGLVMDPNVGTTLAFIHQNDRKDNPANLYYRLGADTMLRADELNRDIIKAGQILHFSATSLRQDPCRTAVHTAVRMAKKNGSLISFDSNYHALFWGSFRNAKREILRIMGYTNILMVSEEEINLLTGETQLEEGAHRLMKLGPIIVLITLGEQGIFYSCRNGSGILPVTYNEKMVDPTGSKEAFLGAIHYRLRGKDIGQVQGLTKGELADIVDYANAAASLTTTKKGIFPAMPSLEEVEYYRENYPAVKY